MTLYQELRKAGEAMHSKVLAATQHLDFDAVRMAKQMTLPVVGRTLMFDGEVEQNAFFDFWFNEYRVNGKILVESVDPVAAGLTPLETELLLAQRQSRTSFFQSEAVSLPEHQVIFRDLLDPQSALIHLTDLGYSESVARLGPVALFTRLITVRGLNMTGGLGFPFRTDRVPGLLQAYRQKMKKVSAEALSVERFKFFFQKHRQIGEKQTFQTVA